MPRPWSRALAAIFAIDTGDRKHGKAAKIDITAVNEKIAALLGSAPDQILINDVVVNPLSHRAYISVSRGRGPGATPVLLRVDGSGKLEEFSLDTVKYSKVSLPNAPNAAEKDRQGQSKRMEAISG